MMPRKLTIGILQTEAPSRAERLQRERHPDLVISMPERRASLFEAVVDTSKLNESFVKLSEQPQAKPTRWMLERVYQDFSDPDGNFLEQFQSTAFDARFFELYLFAYLSRSGFEINRRHPNPDFLVDKAGFAVAIEATTVNPATSGVMAESGRSLDDVPHEEARDYEFNELPIRFGSPLFSKLKKRYWKLDHCRDLPFVIAIEAFHDKGSLGISDSPLVTYLYGQRSSAGWSKQGTLEIDVEKIEEHKLADKVIPSGFFALAGCEHVSAVLFSNSGTVTKFARMGFQYGVGCDEIEMIRQGFAFNPDVNAMDPTFFAYNMDEPPLVETWGQGLVLCHNPKSLHPIPRGVFPDAVEFYVEADQLVSEHRGWHPYASNTLNVFLGETKQQLRDCTPYRRTNMTIAAISKSDFHTTWGRSLTTPFAFGEEHGWFQDGTGGFLGVIIRDLSDRDWGFVVLGRDEHFEFRAIAVESSIPSRDEARLAVQLKIASLLQSPQRIFPADI
jgi:hypothetical protein